MEINGWLVVVLIAVVLVLLFALMRAVRNRSYKQ